MQILKIAIRQHLMFEGSRLGSAYYIILELQLTLSCVLTELELRERIILKDSNPQVERMFRNIPTLLAGMHFLSEKYILTMGSTLNYHQISSKNLTHMQACDTYNFNCILPPYWQNRYEVTKM